MRSKMDADAILREVLQEIALKYDHDTNKIQTKEISSCGANYTSALFLATITTPGRQDLKLFAKVATISEAMRQQIPATNLFLTETIVYTKLVPQMEKIQDEFGIKKQDRIRFAKFYGMRNEYLQETVVLEDLTSDGFGDQDRLKSVTWEYAEAAVTELAKWHALSMAYEHIHPEEAKEYMTNLVYDMKQSDDSAAVGKKMAAGAMQVVKEEYREKLMNFISELKPEDMKMHNPKRKAVFAHGDFRPSNMMQRVKDGKMEIVVIDYQTVHAGCPTNDLVYFLTLATGQAFRRKHYQQIINHYYTQLEKCLKRFNLDIGNLYSKEDYLADFDDSMRQSSLALAIFLLPLITVDDESAPKLTHAEGLDCFAVQPNESYAIRFNGIVEDLVTWGFV